MQIETGFLTPKAPFDYEKTVHFLQNFAPLQDELMIMDQALSIAFNVGEKIVACELASIGTVSEPRLTYTVYCEQKLSPEDLQNTLGQITAFLGLDDALDSFYAIAQEDEDFAPLVQEMYGFHLTKYVTPFQSACWATLAQRNLRVVTLRMKHALLETYGKSIVVNGVTYRAFPTAEQLRDMTEAELLLVVKNKRKAECLHSVITTFNSVEDSFLHIASYEEVEKWLRTIKGCGEWSSSFVLQRGLGRMEKIPFSERGVLAAASRLYGKGRELTRAEVARYGSKYGNYKGYWANYLRIGA